MNAGQPSDDPWRRALVDLTSWLDHRDAAAARAALMHIEPELRLAIPPLVRRTWPGEQVDDALRDFLTRLLDRPLPLGIDDPKRYILRSFRNRCIDLHRALQRRDEAPLQFASGWEPVDATPGADAQLEEEDRASAMRAALLDLPLADRVSVKLVDAPEWLDDAEIDWLAERSGQDRAAILEAISAATDIFALTEIFDAPSVGEPDDRRHRMERFRKRRARARDKLRATLGRIGMVP